MNRTPTPTAERSEAGSGLIATAFGVVVFLLFLLLSVQVLLGLYTTTIVSSTTLSAANRMARSADPTDPAVQQAATESARRDLGSFARGTDRVIFDWTGTTTDEVVLRVQARKMTLLPPAFGSALGNRIDRTVRVRVERFR